MKTYLYIIHIFILLFSLAKVSFTQVTSKQLMEAISEGKAEEVKQLLESRADVNELTEAGAE
jgi:uncharacterized membrane protein YvbJ